MCTMFRGPSPRAKEIGASSLIVVGATWGPRASRQPRKERRRTPGGPQGALRGFTEGALAVLTAFFNFVDKSTT